MVGMREEWEFVLHTARLYERMGCDLLALDLGMPSFPTSLFLSSHTMNANLLAIVKTWEFLTPPPAKMMPNRPPLSPAIPHTSFHARNATQSPADFEFDPRKLLRRRSSLVVADLPTREHVANALAESKGSILEADAEAEEDAGDTQSEDKKEKAEEKKKPPPTQFHEPDASSLLDAFGF